jgi:hypothetical protein
LRVGVDEQCKWRFDRVEGEIMGAAKSEVLTGFDDLCVSSAMTDDLAGRVMTIVINNNQMLAEC